MIGPFFMQMNGSERDMNSFLNGKPKIQDECAEMICWALDDSSMDEPQNKKHKHREIKR